MIYLLNNNTQTDYYSAIKGEIMLFAAPWINLKIVILNEVSQRKTNIMSVICGILKNDTNELIYKRDKVTDIENRLFFWGGG